MNPRILPTLVGFLGALVAPACATTYYVSPAGSDSNNGTSASTPWQTLAKVNATTFSAGDSVLLASGGSWSGTLAPLGSGTSANPITIDWYGGTTRPLIAGPGTTGSVGVKLSNQSGWTISDLEVTNTQSGSTAALTGMTVSQSGSGTVSNITIDNCYIHDVNSCAVGSANFTKASGGIYLSGLTNNILVEDCLIENVATEGLRNSSSTGCTNVVFSNNVIENVYGDGIVIHGAASGCAIQYNTIYNACESGAANFAGCWTYGSTGTVVQYNEVYGQQQGGANDGESFDADLGTNGDIFQYNYSHDNAQGFMLFMGNAQNIIVRYNLAVNDGFSTAGGDASKIIFQDSTSPGGSTTNQVYNNTFYLPNPLVTFFHAGTELTFKNNLISYQGGGSPTFNTGAWSSSAVFENNCFYPSSLTTTHGPAGTVSGNLTSNPLLVGPGTDPTGIGGEPGYQLQSGSPDLGAGLVISANGGADYWGNPVSATAAPNIGAYNGTGVPVLAPTDDTYVQDGSSANTNFGTSSALVTKNDAVGYNRNSYLRFDLASVSGAVANATLYLVPTSEGASGFTNAASLTGTSWTQSTLTWNTAPALGTELATFTVPPVGQVAAIDVTAAAANAQINGNLLGLAVSSPTNQGSTAWVDFGSTNASAANKPILVVNAVPGLAPSADAYVQNGSDANTNYGTSSVLQVKNDAVGYFRNSYLQFSLSGVSGTITRATVYLVPASEGQTGITNAAYLTGSSWTQSGITWNNAPALGTRLASWTVPAAGNQVSFSVTAQAQAAQAAGTPLALAISSPTNQGANAWVDYASGSYGTAGYRPMLVITSK